MKATVKSGLPKLGDSWVENYVNGVNKRTRWHHSPDSHTVCCLWCNRLQNVFSELERLLVIKRTSFEYNSLCCNLVDQVNCFQDSMLPFHCTCGREMHMHLNVYTSAVKCVGFFIFQWGLVNKLCLKHIIIIITQNHLMVIKHLMCVL